MLSELTLNGCWIWRTFSIGTLFDLIMLDTRHYDRSITGKLEELELILSLNLTTSRSILEHWLHPQNLQLCWPFNDGKHTRKLVS
jgi:phosphodiesterase/alkaline phosphatase D-like protein